MEPPKTHGTTLPQQGPTQPAGGCPSGPRPEDLEQGGCEGANPYVGQRAASDAMDSAIAGTSQPLEVTANEQEGKDNSNACDAHNFTRLDAYNLLVKLAKEKGVNLRPHKLSKIERREAILKVIGGQLRDPLYDCDKKKLDFIIVRLLNKCEDWYRKLDCRMPYLIKRHRVYLFQLFIDDVPDDLKPLSSIKRSINLEREEGPPCKILKTDPSQSVSSEDKQKLIKDMSNYLSDIDSASDSEDAHRPEPKKAALNDLSDIDSDPYSEDEQNLTKEKSNGLSDIDSDSNSSTPPGECRPYTPEEALAFIKKFKFSVATYKSVRKDLIERGFPVFPPYREVKAVKNARFPTEVIPENSLDEWFLS